MRCPRLLSTRPWLLTKKKIRERIDYVVRGLDANGAGSTFLGASLTTAQAHRTAAKQHPRRIAIFGGSFDPIHNGHLSVARAADRRFNFDELHFIPASRPPHKLKQHLAPFPHRFAMVSLASTEHPHFVPSLAEAGEDFSGTQLHYSVDTVRYFRHVYHGDRLFFMIGAIRLRKSSRNCTRPACICSKTSPVKFPLPMCGAASSVASPFTGLFPRESRNTFSNRASINEIRILAARRTPGRRSRTRKESRRDHRA